MIDRIKASVEHQWYGRPHWLFLLWPVLGLYLLGAWWRKRRALSCQTAYEVPVVVVGNITVGGTGKTPVILALVTFFKQQGLRVGVVSRGYGGKARTLTLVQADTSVSLVGDEPKLIHQTTGVPVVVGRARAECVAYLATHLGCEVVLSDDGLQHYAMARAVEWVVVDGARPFGNGWRLPIGPLREPVSRLQTVDQVLVNGVTTPNLESPLLKDAIRFEVVPCGWRNVMSGVLYPLDHVSLTQSVAVAGIGRPDKFFNTLKALGFRGPSQAFADHHAFTEADFKPFHAAKNLLMTRKDAVKCEAFAQPHWWALEVEAKLPQALLSSLIKQLKYGKDSKQ